MVEKMSLFFLDHFLEDTDIVGPRNLDGEYPTFLVTDNNAVEQKIRGTHRTRE